MKDHLDELKVLLTAAEEDVEEPVRLLEGRGAQVLHLPLEHYHYHQPDAKNPEERLDMDAYENIVYGYKRNAVYFLERVQQENCLEQVKQRVNLVRDQQTAEFLESEGIPAIYPGHDAKPIDLLEFMLRLQRLGATLYPCGSHQKEEIPGLLQELEIKVHELVCYDRSGPEQEELEAHREQMEGQQPDAVLFHSRSSVNRALAAFPDLDESGIVLVAGSAGAAQKMEEEQLEVAAWGDGNWKSMVDALVEAVRENRQ